MTNLEHLIVTVGYKDSHDSQGHCAIYPWEWDPSRVPGSSWVCTHLGGVCVCHGSSEGCSVPCWFQIFSLSRCFSLWKDESVALSCVFLFPYCLSMELYWGVECKTNQPCVAYPCVSTDSLVLQHEGFLVESASSSQSFPRAHDPRKT